MISPRKNAKLDRFLSDDRNRIIAYTKSQDQATFLISLFKGFHSNVRLLPALFYHFNIGKNLGY